MILQDTKQDPGLQELLMGPAVVVAAVRKKISYNKAIIACLSWSWALELSGPRAVIEFSIIYILSPEQGWKHSDHSVIPTPWRLNPGCDL